jgi:hypothetical protein
MQKAVLGVVQNFGFLALLHSLDGEAQLLAQLTQYLVD